MFLNIYAAFAIIVSGLISLIFFNAVFERRKSICTAAVINLALAMIQAAVFFVKIPALNLCVYVLYNIFFALSVYKSDIKTSVLYTFILTALMMLSEFLVVVIMHVFLAVNAQDLLVGKNMIIFSVICKTMFLFIILAARKIVLKRRTGYNYDSTYYFFIFVPVSTMILLTGLLYIINRLDETESIILLTAALPLIIAEFVCYVVYDHIIEKNRN
ncbi:MAG: hypothetical protein IJR59_05920, partial [Firmicutes bacterium]|nr:hypothetical protein [Bacillota bacterium]